MSPRLFMACLLASSAGCGKHPASSPVTTKPQSDAVAVAADEAQIAAVLMELTQAVRKCAVEQRRAPKNLEELVANGYLSRVPPAPAGKKYAIDKNLQVYLANQ